MTGIDIGLYDYDRHSSIYFFAASPDERIYLRYGGRDARAADSYLDLDSIALALEAGLEQHERWMKGELRSVERPAPRFPREIETLRDAEMARGRCVECHMIADYEASEMEANGTLDKPRDLFRSPDIRDIGIELDVPKGLVVRRASGAAAGAGLRASDRIVAIEGAPVLTFGDLLHAYDRLDRSSTRLALTVERASTGTGRVELSLALPPLWWASDPSYRRWSIDPVTYFDSEPSSAAGGFACEVTSVDRRATHSLRVGDIIYSIGGAEADPVTNRCDLYIRLHVRAGDTVELGVVRDSTRVRIPLNTARQYFRRSASSPNGRR